MLVPKCDGCGKFISWQDILEGNALRREIKVSIDPWHPSIESPEFEHECPSCLAASS